MRPRGCVTSPSSGLAALPQSVPVATWMTGSTLLRKPHWLMAGIVRMGTEGTTEGILNRSHVAAGASNLTGTAALSKRRHDNNAAAWVAQATALSDSPATADRDGRRPPR
jgi:hypothetical protein